jgi:DNA-binding transcriptional MerR regulator
VIAELIPTTKAAKALGVPRTKLYRWWKHGLVTPDYVTPGGHARWNLDALRRQLGDPARALGTKRRTTNAPRPANRCGALGV